MCVYMHTHNNRRMCMYTPVLTHTSTHTHTHTHTPLVLSAPDVDSLSPALHVLSVLGAAVGGATVATLKATSVCALCVPCVCPVT